MSSQSHESYPTASQSQPNIQEETINHTKEKISDVVYEVKPTHLNEFDFEPAELQSEIEVLINDGNPFPPMPNAIEETSQLTVRAIIVGSTLGLIVGASNVYLGLKTGLLVYHRLIDHDIDIHCQDSPLVPRCSVPSSASPFSNPSLTCYLNDMVEDTSVPRRTAPSRLPPPLPAVSLLSS
jgi:hypothetical protein